MIQFGEQVSQKQIADGSIASPKIERFMTPTWGKYKGSLIFIVFPPKTGAYDTIVGRIHGLRRVPKYWTVIDKGINAAGAPGTAPGEIYTDSPARFTNLLVAFRCSVPYTWAKILLE